MTKVFDGGITRISVRKAMAALLISSTLSLDSFSIALASVGVSEEWKTNGPDLFASLSMRISSKPSFIFDMRLCTEYLFMSSCVPLTARNSSLYKLNIAVFLRLHSRGTSTVFGKLHDVSSDWTFVLPPSCSALHSHADKCCDTWRLLQLDLPQASRFPLAARRTDLLPCLVIQLWRN